MTLLVLPNELWDRILYFASLPSSSDTSPNSWIHFYLLGRQICKSWRSSLPRIYLEIFLQHPRRCVIDFDCGCDYVKGVGKCAFGMEMFYHRIDAEDKKRIVFQEGMETRAYEGEERYARAKYGTWEGDLQRFLGGGEDARRMLDRTPYIVTIFGKSLDCDLPGLRYDVGKREVSFGWEGFLDEFCGEYRELERRRTAVVPMAREGDSSSSSLFSALGSALSSDLENHRTARKAVRRERIFKCYKEMYGLKPKADLIDTGHETAQMKRLQYAEEAGVGWDDDDDEDELVVEADEPCM